MVAAAAAAAVEVLVAIPAVAVPFPIVPPWRGTIQYRSVQPAVAAPAVVDSNQQRCYHQFGGLA